MKSFYYKAILLFYLLACYYSPIHTQEHLTWQDHADSTYVFRITRKQAEKFLLTGNKHELLPKLLHTPYASFADTWEDAPEQGHFIYAQIRQNQEYYKYVPILPFQVFLFKEYGILTLQVIDHEGNVRDDAKIKIRSKNRLSVTRVPFDKESHTYRLDDTSTKEERLLTIECNGFRAIFDLHKHIIHPSWYPDQEDAYRPDFYSYFITDKNKYRPGETVRFKSYALSGGRRPLKKDLTVWISTPKGNKKVGTVSPYHPGGYAGEIELHDSLELRLNNSYMVRLQNAKGLTVGSSSFSYEDYELHDSRLEVQVEHPTHYFPDENRIEIKATDANGLFLQDVNADIYLHRSNIHKTYSDLYLLPDTILYQQLKLDNAQPTSFTFPASLFGDADINYTLEVRVATYDTQPLVYKQQVNFYKSHQNIVAATQADSIRFAYLEQGKEVPAKARLTRFRKDAHSDTLVQLPCLIPFRQSIHRYELQTLETDYTQTFRTSNFPSQLKIQGGFSADTFHIELHNPLQLEVSWYVYEGNQLLGKGSGTELEFTHLESDKTNTYYAEIFYHIGGQEETHRQTFTPKTEYLDIDIDLPERIYPGQTIDATISVKDHLHQPVRNVDLTAFAVNSLLHYHLPDLPYYGPEPRRREKRSSYSLWQKDRAEVTQPLNYTIWNRRANLDRLPYYQFTYPKGIFRYTLPTPDGSTQFAPYIMRNGEEVKIYVIERDGEPLYFSWTDQIKSYSFPVDSVDGGHTFALRLHDRVIILDNFLFEKGKKTILSIDLDHLPQNHHGQTRNLVREMFFNYSYNRTNIYQSHQFTTDEARRYEKYISAIPLTYGPVTYLEQKDTVYAIHTHYLDRYVPTSRSPILSGPIRPGKTRYNGGIEYRHEGNFSYQYEDNVVYKYSTSVLPNELRFSSSVPSLIKLGDFVLSWQQMKKEIDDNLEKIRKAKDKWHTTSIRIAHNKLNFNLVLPTEEAHSGIYAMVFDNHSQPIYYFNDLPTDRFQVPEGTYDLIALYNNGECLIRRDVPIRHHTYTMVRFQEEDRQPADTLSKHLFHLSPLEAEPVEISIPRKEVNTYLVNVSYSITGTIRDAQGEPIIGASIEVKGTNIGTISDIDGHFSLYVPYEKATLQISYIGYITKEIEVYNRTIVDVVLEEDSQSLDEVVVVGYGTARRASYTSAVSTVSARDAQSEPETEDEEEDDDPDTSEENLYQELLTLQGLRSNFSDVGFWEPRLYTDRKGKASFTVTFPDNITRWEAIVYGMNRRLHTGTLRRSIRSYKPLMAELRMPRFLVEGDTSYFAANLRNYTQDPEINGTLYFALEADTLLRQPITFANAYPYHPKVESFSGDSLTATLLFTRDDGYTDGEKRSIPIQQRGTEIAEGNLSILSNGQTIEAQAQEGEDVHISITGDQVEVYQQTIHYLHEYKYLCNEQMASKLIGLIHDKLYCEFAEEPFRYDKEVRHTIRQLLENRNPDKLWSWWGRSRESSYWMSAHILQALHLAREAGYTVALDLTAQEDYKYTINYRRPSLRDIDLLYALSLWNVPQDYEAAIEILDSLVRKEKYLADSIAHSYNQPHGESFIREKLRLLEIRQQQHVGYSADSLTRYLKKDILGRIEVEDKSPGHRYRDKLPYHLSAYRIIRNDSTLQDMLPSLQLSILSTKGHYGWNTYQASSALSTVFPDLIRNGTTQEQVATLRLTGKDNQVLSAFPYHTKLTSGEQLRIEKTAGIPLFYSEHVNKRVTEKSGKEIFNIQTRFAGGDTLQAGREVNLSVSIEVTEDNAEYVMIEIPIPAGCSYASQSSRTHYRETYREYYKEKTVIFCEKMPAGTYHFEIPLLPRFEGSYQMNPAKAELMYLPVIYDNNDIRTIVIGKEF
ncbi:MAG: carboxypeptidase-like regulatory domain-containing protein [Bacteroides sp.]|nr:carboxypeptidase-like regulatory domain-containing protein [Bacteroides sp.]